MEAPDPPTGRSHRHGGVKIGAVILAAGSSSRLGQPKQLLQYEGQTLVRRAAQAAVDAGCRPIAVVVGAERKKVAETLRGLALNILPNESWEQGIGSSIRLGVATLRECDALILLLCDQPRIDADLLRELIALQERTEKPMIASAYAGTVGVPALFTHACFPVLLALGNESGAKTILRARPGEVASVAFPGGICDIDTPEDLPALGA